MASSSKRRASSGKQSSAGKARAISVKRKDALPRTANVSAARRKPVIQPPIEAAAEPLATAGVGSKKKAHRLQPTRTAAGRTKTTRAAGRASGKLNKPAAVEPAPTADEGGAMTALAASEVVALAVFETELEVEASAIVEETTIVEPPPLPVEAMTFPSTASARLPFPEETRGPPLARTAAESPAPAAPAVHHGKRALITGVARLLSTLSRWAGVR